MHDLRPAHLLDDDVGHATKEIGAPAGDVTDAVQRRQPAIGFLHHVVDGRRRRQAPAQPIAHIAFVRKHVSSRPANELGSTLPHVAPVLNNPYQEQ